MNNRRRAVRATDADVLAILEPVRRVALNSGGDPDRADDVVQETLTRVLISRDRLDGRALTPYALSIARNLVVSEHRQEALDARHAPRLYERDEAQAGPVDHVEQREEAAALAAAMRALTDQDRELLGRREIDRRDLRALAAQRGTSAQALAARLARLRARLRVDYLINLRRVELPTPRCRAVLLTLSTGQQRRKQASSVKEHLNDCATCSELSELVESRRRPIAGLFPLPLLIGWDWLRTTIGKPIARHPWPTAAAAGGVTAAAIGAVFLLQPQEPPRPAPAAAVAPARSDAVDVNARVLSVPVDEGFWIALPTGRSWVQMTGSGESPQRITTGATVRFTARRVSHGPGFARQMGLPPGGDARALDAARTHLEVPATQVRLVT